MMAPLTNELYKAFSTKDFASHNYLRKHCGNFVHSLIYESTIHNVCNGLRPFACWNCFSSSEVKKLISKWLLSGFLISLVYLKSSANIPKAFKHKWMSKMKNKNFAVQHKLSTASKAHPISLATWEKFFFCDAKTSWWEKINIKAAIIFIKRFFSLFAASWGEWNKRFFVQVWRKFHSFYFYGIPSRWWNIGGTKVIKFLNLLYKKHFSIFRSNHSKMGQTTRKKFSSNSFSEKRSAEALKVNREKREN